MLAISVGVVMLMLFLGSYYYQWVLVLGMVVGLGLSQIESKWVWWLVVTGLLVEVWYGLRLGGSVVLLELVYLVGVELRRILGEGLGWRIVLGVGSMGLFDLLLGVEKQWWVYVVVMLELVLGLWWLKKTSGEGRVVVKRR